jgi:hypothetical protein
VAKGGINITFFMFSFFILVPDVKLIILVNDNQLAPPMVWLLFPSEFPCPYKGIVEAPTR